MSDYIDTQPTTIEVDGETWVIPYDRVYDLTLYEGNLVNISSSNMTLYKSFIEDTSNVYPRLVCNVGRVCYVQESYNNYDYLNSVSSLERNIQASSFLIDPTNLLLVALLMVSVIKWVFIRK